MSVHVIEKSRMTPIKEVLHRLVDVGNTMIIIEHNLDVIKTAGWIIDLEPEGGEKGGYIVGEGTPELASSTHKTYTGKYLGEFLNGKHHWVL